MSTRKFRESLGTEYASRYDAATIAKHAQIAARRGTSLVSLDTFERQRGHQVGLCVVAKDTPGLLATITAALVTCGFDIASAEAYTRVDPAGVGEAVDVFWIFPREPQSPPAEVRGVDLARLRQVLMDMLEGRSTGLPHPLPRKYDRPVETMVRFLESDDGTFTTLEVETDDRSGLLQALASALFAARVQINSSQVRTNGQRVYDRFKIVEVDGTPISRERRLEIQVAVLGAVDPSHQV
jgi:[protein-PII] uridylyltransferase